MEKYVHVVCIRSIRSKEYVKISQGTLQFDRHGQNYYTGDFILNIPFGKGRRQYASGNLYEGMWVNGKRHGYGIFSWSNGNGEYMGQWINGVQVCFICL